MRRPINRGTLTRHLRNITKPPTKPTKNGLLSFAGNVAKLAIQGAVVYLAVTALQGQRGKDRLKEDLHAVAVSPSVNFLSFQSVNFLTIAINLD